MSHSTIDGVPTIRTFTGRRFNFMWPMPGEIDLQDIAHALSQVCRFAGQTRSFYSVAQHAVLVSHLVKGPDGLKFCGLMHDSSEAYIGDVSRPLKHYLQDYRDIEERLMHAIAVKFGFVWPMPEEVRKADNMALALEGARFMFGDEVDFGALPDGVNREASHLIVRGLPPETAKKMFLERFEALR